MQNDSDDIWAGIEQSETTNVLKALIDPSIVTDARQKRVQEARRVQFHRVVALSSHYC